VLTEQLRAPGFEGEFMRDDAIGDQYFVARGHGVALAVLMGRGDEAQTITCAQAASEPERFSYMRPEMVLVREVP
jgi:hypothetical protein